jgi:hypothetical protein
MGACPALRLMSAALDRIYRIMQNFSWVDTSFLTAKYAK